ncbi:MAG: class I SAM-dependent methyltransferase [Microbacteriaceae bacterium]|nr:class I SAM-dependent methyltransferase [Microbacteriaceae bacterium]
MSNNEWDKKYSTDEYIYTKTANRFVVEYCEPLKGNTAIDLGGGEGRNSIWLAKQGFKVENIDFSQVALDKYLRFAEDESVSELCVANCADATDFESKLAPVDLGVIAYLQIPQSELRKAVLRLASSIKPGGHLFGVWHSRDNLVGGFGGPKDPDVLPNVAIMQQLMVEAGFEVLELTNREGQIQTREGLKPSVTLVFLAQRPIG